MRHLTNAELTRLLVAEPENKEVWAETVRRFPELVALETSRIKELESDLDSAEEVVAKLSRGGCVCEL